MKADTGTAPQLSTLGLGDRVKVSYKNSKGEMVATKIVPAQPSARAMGPRALDPSPNLGSTGSLDMAKKKARKRKYSLGVGKDVERAMRRRKRGTLWSGKGGRGGKVKSREQAIAIALSEARKKGKKVLRQPRGRRG